MSSWLERGSRLIAALALSVLCSASWANPTVTITAPAAGSVLTPPADVVIQATVEATDDGELIKTVTWKRDGSTLRTDTMSVSAADLSYTDSNVAVGSHT